MQVTKNTDSLLLREAIRLAVANVQTGRGGPFGAVIARDGEIIGRGSNLVTSTNDPTAHAEVVAIRDACKTLDTYSLVGCDIYASCEPCPLCLAAIYWARLATIHFAANCNDAAEAGFDDRVFYDELAKGPDQRSIPVEQMLREEALVAFDAWRSKIDRVPY